MKQKRAAVFDPYFDSLGGGERYTSTLAKLLENKGFQVDFWWPKDMKQDIFDRFAVPLNNPQFIHFFPGQTSLFNRLVFTSRYRLLFWVSDGSIPLSLAKKTIIHFQVPFHSKACATFANRVKIRPYTVVCNSQFTKSFIDRTYQVKSKVIYPPVDTRLFKPLPKKNLIVSIGRLSNILHSKNQEVLIRAFSRLHERLPGYKLVLAGGALNEEYIRRLRDQAANLPVEIIPNASITTLVTLLGQAKIFWSATGYRINIDREPEKVEHFGITAVEASSAGAVPIVTGAGGHLETVTPGVTGMHWHTLEELLDKTYALATHAALWKQLSQAAQARSQNYSTDVFYKQFEALI